MVIGAGGTSCDTPITGVWFTVASNLSWPGDPVDSCIWWSR